MANQDVSDKKDRNGGGDNVNDVTKADVVATPDVPKMIVDLGLNSRGPGRFSPTEDN